MTPEEIAELDKMSGLSQQEVSDLDTMVNAPLPQKPESLTMKIANTLPVIGGTLGLLTGGIAGTALFPGAGTITGSAFGTAAGTGTGEAMKQSLLNLTGENKPQAIPQSFAERMSPKAILESPQVSSAMTGPVSGIETYATGKAFDVMGKVLHPFRTIGEFRAAKIAEAEGKTISGDKLIEALDKQITSPTMKKTWDRFMVGARQMYEGKSLSIDDAVELNKIANQAYSNSTGVAGKGTTNLFNKVLGDEIKRQLEISAPQVARANKIFKTMYSAKKLTEKSASRAVTGAGGAVLGALGIKNLLSK